MLCYNFILIFSIQVWLGICRNLGETLLCFMTIANYQIAVFCFYWLVLPCGCSLSTYIRKVLVLFNYQYTYMYITHTRYYVRQPCSDQGFLDFVSDQIIASLVGVISVHSSEFVSEDDITKLRLFRMMNYIIADQSLEILFAAL